jgi:cell division protein ZapA (FtsZ GTPase activity inhibitor)
MGYFSREFFVRPQEYQGLREAGSRTLMVQIAQIFNQKLERIRQSHDLTLEYERVGAIKGIITKKDGVTTRENLFTLFGVTQQTEDFVLGTGTTDLKAKTRSAVRKSKQGLGGGMSATGYVALCGVEFFDRLVNHASVKELYLNQPRSAELNTPDRFPWQGITWESYDGSVGGTDFIPASEAYLVPMGVPGLFETVYGPANTMSAVNQIAQELYINRKELDYDKGISGLYESNHISMCTKPRSVIKLLSSN